MKPQEKATELIEKFGSKSLDILEETFDIWEYKKLIRSQEMVAYQYNKDKYETAKRGFDISVRTLSYWNKVKNIINNENRNNKRTI